MAGGTGGHIFPGLAVAEALREKGWRVHWLGAPDSMESQLVPKNGFAFEAVAFGGVRGKGLMTLALLPMRLLRAFWQSLQVVRRVKPDVVLGLGGYISFPADRVFMAFPGVFKKGQWVGNPLRMSFIEQAAPAARFAGRMGPLRVLVVGGSLGAKALNDIVPQALALIPADVRPVVTHQSGAKQIDQLRSNYQAVGVQAELTPFIDDMATAFAQADLVICRAGASTVTELAAVGAAAVLVPFPFAVDDHQTTNAQFLVASGGGWLVQQADLTAQNLADRLRTLSREQLLSVAEKAHEQRKTNATREVVLACEELAA
jgi:UDP-N-acetylglucosamine--N-acetylmuramyl-(pentapeptide) pyrophosphoryl-undecaprenol N-acetylglucosamine transferase